MNTLRKPFGDFNTTFDDIGVTLPNVLLPSESVNMNKWSVVACDQYTSQADYWDKVESIVGSAPSTLRLILPEIYLDRDDTEKRICKINKSMAKYIDEGILVPSGIGLIYLERKTPYVGARKGLMLAVDLEKYDYGIGSQSLIRATENTVIDRLPPRVKIREHAPIEIPHIQILIDDPAMTVIEPLTKTVSSFEGESSNPDVSIEKIYDFDLMAKGGHVKGYKITNEKIILDITRALKKLAEPEHFYKKYNVNNDKGVLLFAVGDGNHSLASAKVHWENVKAALPKNKHANHPARYAMAELLNIHDKDIVFEPIHRVLFNVDSEKLLRAMEKFFIKSSPFSYKRFSSEGELNEEIKIQKNKCGSHHHFSTMTGNKYYLVTVEEPLHNLDVATLQEFLDYYIEENPGVKIDYIHGDDALREMSKQDGNFGFYLNSMDKHQLFKTVILDGTLPRKTFSMGEAEEKRFYLESRRIVE